MSRSKDSTTAPTYKETRIEITIEFYLSKGKKPLGQNAKTNPRSTSSHNEIITTTQTDNVDPSIPGRVKETRNRNQSRALPISNRAGDGHGGSGIGGTTNVYIFGGSGHGGNAEAQGFCTGMSWKAITLSATASQSKAG